MDKQRAKKIIFTFVKSSYGKIMKRQYEELEAWIAETEKFNPYQRTDDCEYDTMYTPQHPKSKKAIRDLGI